MYIAKPISSVGNLSLMFFIRDRGFWFVEYPATMGTSEIYNVDKKINSKS